MPETEKSGDDRLERFAQRSAGREGPLTGKPISLDHIVDVEPD
jgi:hypothetical protein